MFKEQPKEKWFNNTCVVRESSVHGLGCFATRDIQKNEIIERSPVVIFYPGIFDDFWESRLERHVLNEYIFKWPNARRAIAFGNISLCNHADDPNTTYRCCVETPCVELLAKDDIKCGDEIFISYHGRPGGRVVFSDSGEMIHL